MSDEAEIETTQMHLVIERLYDLTEGQGLYQVFALFLQTAISQLQDSTYMRGITLTLAGGIIGALLNFDCNDAIVHVSDLLTRAFTLALSV